MAKKIMWSVLFVLVAPFLVWLVLSAPAYFISWFTPAFVDSSMYWLIGWVSWRPLYLLAALIYLFVPYDPHPRSSTLGY